MKDQRTARYESFAETATQRLLQLGIQLPPPPEPFGIYAETVQTGNLLFLTGMPPLRAPVKLEEFHDLDPGHFTLDTGPAKSQSWFDGWLGISPRSSAERSSYAE